MLRIFYKYCRAFLPNQHFSEVMDMGRRGKITQLWGWKRNWGWGERVLYMVNALMGIVSQFIPLIAISLVIQLHNYHSQSFYSCGNLYQPGHY